MRDKSTQCDHVSKSDLHGLIYLNTSSPGIGNPPDN